MTRTYVSAPRAVLAMGAVGVLVGGAVAAARGWSRVKKQEMTREEAVKAAVRESGTTGLATATATAVVGVLGSTGILPLAGMVLVAAGTKHLADKALDARCARVAPALAEPGEPASTQTGPKKAAPKKTAPKKSKLKADKA